MCPDADEAVTDQLLANSLRSLPILNHGKSFVMPNSLSEVTQTQDLVTHHRVVTKKNELTISSEIDGLLHLNDCVWLNYDSSDISTFGSLSKPCTKLSDLNDGIILSEVVEHIIPHYFDSSSIKKEAENNDFLKISNLKKINTALDEFFQNELGFSSEVEVDTAAIIRDGNEAELVKLLQLILGTAIECENKVEYIQSIMQLDAASQRVLMDVIQEVMALHQKQRGNISHDRTMDTTSRSDIHTGPSSADYEKLQHEYSSLAAENAQLSSEKEALVVMMTEMENQMNQLTAQPTVVEKKNDVDSAEVISKKNAENEKLLIHNHSLQQELEERENLIVEMKKRQDELMRQASDARSLRDEVDLLREKAASVEELEDRLKKVKKKADAVDDLKKQLKAVEEQSELYLKRSLDLEESAKKATSYKTQVDTYKEQNVNLTAEINSLKLSEEKKDKQLQSLQMQVNQHNEQTKRRQSTIESLQKEVEHLRQSSEEKLMESHISGNDSMMIGGVTDLNVKEKLIRLEAENNRLKEGAGGAEQVVQLENKIDDLQRLVNKYSKHNEELKQRLAEQNDAGGEVNSAEVSELRASLSVLTQEQTALQQTMVRLEAENRRIAEDNNVLLREKQKTEETMTQLKSAQDEVKTLQAEKVKLEGYLRTAKNMIKTERTKVDGEVEKVQKKNEENIVALKAQLKEKETLLALKEQAIEESRKASLHEQKLMSTAVYELGLELQRLRVPKPDIGTSPRTEATPPPSGGQSLLAQKRSGKK
ncbi:hypothetical protein PROFUN_04645 [Planoprotostelium fungivorum]|uniref:Calponin-homology (CH) domain-containing protein n=1 Tax=Planoprotostelium fungivorum TaxID=1890364 RepID=A0A2P6NUS8_9EUKA|nr:hypothetical protein PROFUN_04645 [Planoprotostelium fungivorum]